MCVCTLGLFHLQRCFLSKPSGPLYLPSSVSGCIGVTLGTGGHWLEGLDGSV